MELLSSQEHQGRGAGSEDHPGGSGNRAGQGKGGEASGGTSGDQGRSRTQGSRSDFEFPQTRSLRAKCDDVSNRDRDRGDIRVDEETAVLVCQPRFRRRGRGFSRPWFYNAFNSWTFFFIVPPLPNTA